LQIITVVFEFLKAPLFVDLLLGGLTVGTVTILEEDHHSDFARILLNYFLSEGFACKQNIFVASADDEATSYVKRLPYISTARTPSPSTTKDISESSASLSASGEGTVDLKAKKIEAAQQVR